MEKAALDAVANNRDIVTQSIKGFQKFFAENLSAHVRLVGISGGRMVKYSIAESGVDSLRLAQARLVFDPVDEKDEAGRLLSSIQGFEEFCFYENGMVLCYIGDVVVLRKAGLKYLILEDPIGRPRHSMIKPAMP